VAPSLMEIIEAPGAHALPPHPRVAKEHGFIFLSRGPGIGAVQRIRLGPDDLETARQRTHELAHERDLTTVHWWVSPLTEPRDVGSRIGLEHAETLGALALTSPPAAEEMFDVRLVETFEDYVAASEIDSIANSWPAASRGDLERMWLLSRERFVVWLAFDGDRPVGMGRCAVADGAMIMIGGAVHEQDRGRGIYRSLIAARWRTAIERGIPALVTAANHQSRPILERLGFDNLGAIEIHADMP
jgi:GNAT superfamily N-acetyltransferase